MLNRWSVSEIPILMDDVECESASANFFLCSTRGTGNDCGHNENVFLSCYMSCSDWQSQFDVAGNIFTPSAALSTDIGLCRIDKSNQASGILMVRNNGVWGSVGVSYIPILSNDVELRDITHIVSVVLYDTPRI